MHTNTHRRYNGFGIPLLLYNAATFHVLHIAQPTAKGTECNKRSFNQDSADKLSWLTCLKEIDYIYAKCALQAAKLSDKKCERHFLKKICPLHLFLNLFLHGIVQVYAHYKIATTHFLITSYYYL